MYQASSFSQQNWFMRSLLLLPVMEWFGFRQLIESWCLLRYHATCVMTYSWILLFFSSCRRRQLCKIQLVSLYPSFSQKNELIALCRTWNCSVKFGPFYYAINLPWPCHVKHSILMITMSINRKFALLLATYAVCYCGSWLMDHSNSALDLLYDKSFIVLAY